MEKFTKEEWIDDLAPLQKMIDQISKEQPELGAELKKALTLWKWRDCIAAKAA